MMVVVPPLDDNDVVMMVVMTPPDDDPVVMMVVVMMELGELHPASRGLLGPVLIVSLEQLGGVRHGCEQLRVRACLRNGRRRGGRHRSVRGPYGRHAGDGAEKPG